MSTKQAWARGGTILGATLLIIIGIFQILLGIAAVVRQGLYVVTSAYPYQFDTAAWGWIHIGIGTLAVVAGFTLFTGRAWARVVAITMAAISAIANFLYLPYYPFWSLLIIALDIFVIWAVATVRTPLLGEEVTRGYYAGAAGQQERERWPENVRAGRHWAPEPGKEATGAETGRTGQFDTPEHAAARARAAEAAQQQQQQQPRTPPPGTQP